MAKFRKKPVVIEAVQWSKLGDHDAVVQFKVHHDIHAKPCRRCATPRYLDHGWVDTLEGGHIVCPGDWITKGVAGEFYPCKPAIFDATYDVVK